MEFQERFADEEACREYLFASRWPEGFAAEQRGRRHASPPAGLAVQGLRCSDLGHVGAAACTGPTADA